MSPWQNPSLDQIRAAFVRTATVAIVGLSDKPDRPSYGVAMYLARHFTVVPVNPSLKVWNGIAAYGALSEIPNTVKVDLVVIFRRSEEVPAIVDTALSRGVPFIWMQQGVVHDAAAAKAVAAGAFVVMDACSAVVHRQLGPHL
jgi:predicted CoA-binding protein